MMIVIFCLLPMTRTMIREAVPDKENYFFVASLLCLSGEKTHD
jgi:hypothetical protein